MLEEDDYSGKININQLDKLGRNALHYASKEGHREVVEFLIQRGIDISTKDKESKNALHFASFNGHTE